MLQVVHIAASRDDVLLQGSGMTAAQVARSLNIPLHELQCVTRAFLQPARLILDRCRTFALHEDLPDTEHHQQSNDQRHHQLHQGESVL